MCAETALEPVPLKKGAVAVEVGTYLAMLGWAISIAYTKPSARIYEVIYAIPPYVAIAVLLRTRIPRGFAYGAALVFALYGTVVGIIGAIAGTMLAGLDVRGGIEALVLVPGHFIMLIGLMLSARKPTWREAGEFFGGVAWVPIYYVLAALIVKKWIS